MARRLLAASVLGAMAICTAFYSSAQAQQPECGPHDDVLRVLGARFNEVPVAGGLVSGGAQYLEILAAPDGSTWTVLVVQIVNGQRVACLAASGENWRAAPVTVPGRGA